MRVSAPPPARPPARPRPRQRALQPLGLSSQAAARGEEEAAAGAGAGGEAVAAAAVAEAAVAEAGIEAAAEAGVAAAAGAGLEAGGGARAAGPEACTARLARAVEAFAHVLSESLIEAVLRSGEMTSGEVRSGEVPSQEVFASLTPLLRELAADLHRIGGAAPATWRAVGELAKSAREIGMRCLAYASPDDDASPESWTRGLEGWFEVCDGLAESVLGRAAH